MVGAVGEDVHGRAVCGVEEFHRGYTSRPIENLEGDGSHVEVEPAQLAGAVA